MISGVDLPPGKTAIAFARAGAGGAGGAAGASIATIAGTNLVCGTLEAAMANGMLAHSDETDDSHAPSHSHPGCAVVPAALGSRWDADVRDLPEVEDPRPYVDLVLDDEFPLSIFYSSLKAKLEPVLRARGASA